MLTWFLQLLTGNAVFVSDNISIGNNLYISVFYLKKKTHIVFYVLNSYVVQVSRLVHTWFSSLV